MKIDIITLFPDMFKGPFDMSMLWKAQDKGLAQIRIRDLREFGLGTRRTVDDTPYGGGDGMVLKVDVMVEAIEAARAENPGARVIAMTPSGHRFMQATAQELSELPGLILLAGHYEGFDERIMAYVDDQLSIGDYVLTGGELPAMVVADAVIRLIPGVLGGEQSAHDESFSEPGLLEYPHYTRPQEFRGEAVPEVLQNGHHAEIAKWRRERALEKTRAYRPDLLPSQTKD
ncbi:MAG TPA: tRNA (guanosine(37)-N1)-methyltransferase TrmD [Candidatus Saccharimonadia bacterium]|jgi:tRNA (guanine37-N1)-methyltransferase|nr:tRNA (guanosine(37)-N1)-methyltransferase TrmD [Candidatus Saccharimonadia bacterium]